MSRVIPMILVFERSETLHSLDRSTFVVGANEVICSLHLLSAVYDTLHASLMLEVK
jgi:hypothetical protein